MLHVATRSRYGSSWRVYSLKPTSPTEPANGWIAQVNPMITHGSRTTVMIFNLEFGSIADERVLSNVEGVSTVP